MTGVVLLDIRPQFIGREPAGRCVNSCITIPFEFFVVPVTPWTLCYLVLYPVLYPARPVSSGLADVAESPRAKRRSKARIFWSMNPVLSIERFALLVGLAFFFGLAFEELYAQSASPRPGGILTPHG